MTTRRLKWPQKYKIMRHMENNYKTTTCRCKTNLKRHKKTINRCKIKKKRQKQTCNNCRDTQKSMKGCKPSTPWLICSCSPAAEVRGLLHVCALGATGLIICLWLLDKSFPRASFHWAVAASRTDIASLTTFSSPDIPAGYRWLTADLRKHRTRLLVDTFIQSTSCYI